MKKPYVILDAEILSSSVWSENATVRLVWITLLILCDTEGNVGASVPGIATAAGVSLQEAQDALARLQAPDPYSRTKANEGRRLEAIPRGWRVLNFIEHLERLSSDRTRARDRMRRHRERKQRDPLPSQEVPAETGSRGIETRSDAGYVTVPAGKREEGVGNREQGRTEERTDASVRRFDPDPGRRVASEKNPLVTDRPALERESLALTNAIRESRQGRHRRGDKLAADEPTDGAEIFVAAAKYEGALRQKCNPATMSDSRLLNTVLDLRATLKAEQEKRAKVSE